MKNALKKALERYIDTTTDKKIDLQLLDEFKSYSSNALREFKIKRVYRKLLKAKKYNLAKRMEDKYSSVLNFKSDAVMAFGLCLQTLKKKKYGK